MKRRKKGRRNVLVWIILISSAILFAITAIRLWPILSGYQEGRETYRKVEEAAKIPEAGKEEKTKPDFTPDLSALKAINPDCVGYLYCKDVLSYPVVQGTDNFYYLTHLFDGTENASGTIFLDSECNGFKGRNSILYGHNMQDGSMFGNLYRYEEESFYKKHPVMDLYTEEGHERYHVLAAYRTQIRGTAYKTLFSREEDFQSFLGEIAACSSYETEHPNLQKVDSVLTLSTCTWDSSPTERFVVVCVHEPETKE